MENEDTPEVPLREGRGRQGKLIPITIHLPASDHSILMNLTLRKMRQMGQDVHRDQIISDALGHFSKCGSRGD